MTQRLRAVIDTNVLVAAVLKPKGTCARLLNEAVDQRWRPVLSPNLLRELEIVLRRPKFASKVSEEAIRDFIAGLVSIAEVVPDPISTVAHTSDPDDDYLVALALAANVDVLVSGDSDLKEMAGSSVVVEVPAAFLERVCAP